MQQGGAAQPQDGAAEVPLDVSRLVAFGEVVVAGYKVVGQSLAGEETCLYLPELKVSLDVGRANRGIQPDRANVVLLTHGHLDHAGGLANWAASRCGKDIAERRKMAEGGEADKVHGSDTVHSMIVAPEKMRSLVSSFLRAAEAMGLTRFNGLRVVGAEVRGGKKVEYVSNLLPGGGSRSYKVGEEDADPESWSDFGKKVLTGSRSFSSV